MNGSSINNRPRLPEPIGNHQETKVLPGLDVDFDEKCHEEYIHFDDVAPRAVYDQVLRGKSQSSIYPGVLNNSKKEKKKACRSLIIYCCIFTLLCVNLLALPLAGFALGSARVAPDKDLDATVAQLRLEVDELRRNLGTHRNVHNVSSQLEELKRICPDSDTSTVATPLPSATMPPASTSCTTIRKGVCGVSSRTILGTSPGFSECTTSSVALDSGNSEEYTSDVFCSVNLEQLMPTSATLLFIDGVFSCACSAFEIPNPGQAELLDFDCEMYVTRCPALIRFPGD